MITALGSLLMSLASLAPAGPAGGLVVEVEAGSRDRTAAVVTVPWPAGAERPALVVLRSRDDRKTTPAQWATGDSPALIFVAEGLKAGQKRRYDVEPAGPVGQPEMTCRDDGRALTVRQADLTVLRYNTAVVEPPQGIDPLYRRSGYIHPLMTPSGKTVTGDFAPDHAHQHAVFFAWVNTTFNGHKVDFWNQPGKTGRVSHVETLGTTSGPVFAGFTTRLRHEDISQKGEPTPVLDEVWTVRAYPAQPGRPFVVDFESRQVCVASSPLSINTYHYGGFGLRGNSAWLDPTAQGNDPPRPERSNRSDFLTSEGKTRADGNHTRPRWVDLSGDLQGGAAGVAVLDHPGNFRFPQPVRLHPNKPYFCFAPMVPGGFSLEPGKPYTSRYRMVVHDGRLDRAEIDRLWAEYAEPVGAKLASAEKP